MSRIQGTQNIRDGQPMKYLLTHKQWQNPLRTKSAVRGADRAPSEYTNNYANECAKTSMRLCL